MTLHGSRGIYLRLAESDYLIFGEGVSYNNALIWLNPHNPLTNPALNSYAFISSSS